MRIIYCWVIRIHGVCYLFPYTCFTEHNIPLDVDKMNWELIERDYNVWDALESSKWLPVEGLECN
jgi:hypothetical protein